MNLRRLWPFVWRKTYEDLKIDHNAILEALKHANEEIHRQRLLIAGFRGEDKEIQKSVSRVLRKT